MTAWTVASKQRSLARRASSPPTSGHRKTGARRDCECSYCEWSRVNERERSERRNPGKKKKVISPDSDGHAKRVVIGCMCNYCEWVRERSRLSAIARLAIPENRRRTYALSNERRRAKRGFVPMSPPTSGHIKNNPHKGCKCEWCEWRRNKTKERARHRARRELQSRSKERQEQAAAWHAVRESTPPTSGHLKGRRLTGCSCAHCEWRRERCKRDYRERNPETDLGRLRAASPPTSGHPKVGGVRRHCKCEWCEWWREIKRARGILKDSVPESPAPNGHAKKGAVVGCECAYCKYIRNRSRERSRSMTKQDRNRRHRKKREATRAAVDLLLKKNPSLKRLLAEASR